MAPSSRTAIVTGASRGIGRGIALELARTGASLMLAARSREALEEVADEALKAGAPAALAVDADLAEPREPERVVARAVEEFGRLDILVNNAGATKRGDFLELADEDHLAGFALKYHGAVRFCRAAWPHLVRSGGAVVNISGIAALTPEAEFTIGGPVNAALINFSKALAKRGVKDGVRVNVLCPGHTVTDRLAHRIEAYAKMHDMTPEDAREALRESYGIARFGEVSDIAAMVAFLCSDQASYVQGATITVDGGITPGI